MSSERIAGLDSAVVGRGALVFVAGMALAAASFVVEQLVVKTIKNR